MRFIPSLCYSTDSFNEWQTVWDQQIIGGGYRLTPSVLKSNLFECGEEEWHYTRLSGFGPQHSAQLVMNIDEEINRRHCRSEASNISKYSPVLSVLTQRSYFTYHSGTFIASFDEIKIVQYLCSPLWSSKR